MHVTIHSHGFTSKPQQEDIFQLRQCANLECKDMSIGQLADALSKGNTFYPALFDLSQGGNIRGELFLSSECVVLDIDNQENAVSFEDMYDTLLISGLVPCLMYHSFSSVFGHHKYRVIYQLSKEITKENARKYDIILYMLLALIPQADKACKDYARMFFGTNKPLDRFYVNQDAFLDEIILYERYIDYVESTFSNTSRQFKSIARSWGVSLTDRNIPHVEYDEDAKTIQPDFIGVFGGAKMKYNARGQAEKVIESSMEIPVTTVERNPPIEIEGWEAALIKKSHMYREFVKGSRALAYHERMFLFSNLMSISGGQKRMKEILRQHIDIYEHDAHYYEKQISAWKRHLKKCIGLEYIGYHQQYDDWLVRNGCTSILAGLKTNGFIPEYHSGDECCISVDDGFVMLKQEFYHSMESDDNKVYAIKAGVGIGKTELYVNYDYSSYKKVLIALPTHALAVQVEERMRIAGQQGVVRRLGKPEIPNNAIRKRYLACLSAGMHSQAERIFRAYYEENPTEEYQLYQEMERAVVDAKIVLATHSYTSHACNVEDFDLVIIDEDVITDYIKVETVKYCELRQMFQEYNIPELDSIRDNVLSQLQRAYEDRMGAGMAEQAFSVCHQLTGVPPTLLNSINVSDDEIVNLPNIGVFQFLNAQYFCVNGVSGREFQNDISFVVRNPFQYRCKTLILSATLNEHCLTDFFQSTGRDLEYVQIPMIKNQGTIHQDLTHPFSHIDMEKHFSDRITFIKERVPNWEECLFITFKDMTQRFEAEGFQLFPDEYGYPLHFNNLSGIDSLKGKDLIIAGKFAYPEQYYRLIGEVLGYRTTGTNQTIRKGIYNGHESNLYVFPNDIMRNLQLYLMESALVQAAGRARTARTDASVYVFGNMPLGISDITEYQSIIIKTA